MATFIMVFWLFSFLLLWTFLGYPVLVMVLSRLFSQPWQKDAYRGSVSMIIAAYNEEEIIRDKVLNCLSLDFGSVDVEILIVSDGSVDKTNTILEEYRSKFERLRIITYHPRAGKANALNVAVEQAQGEVLIFSDANVMVGEESCKFLVAPFADPMVGVVCGRVLVKARGSQEVAGESLYMKYESVVQYSEAMIDSMVGVDGALFAMRRELFCSLTPGTILDDFTLSMRAPAVRMRIVYEPRAKAIEEVVPSAENEFKRKARIVAGGYQFLFNFLKSDQSFSPGMWFAFFSHKILKWLSPFLLIVVFSTNIFLIQIEQYRILLIMQICFYLLAGVGFMNKELRSRHIVYLPYFFCVVNLAALIGFFRFLGVRQGSLWEKIER